MSGSLRAWKTNMESDSQSIRNLRIERDRIHARVLKSGLFNLIFPQEWTNLSLMFHKNGMNPIISNNKS